MTVTQQDLLKKLEESASKADLISAAYREVLTASGSEDVDIGDGEKTPSLTKRLIEISGLVASVNGQTGAVEITPESLGLGSAAKLDDGEVLLKSEVNFVAKSIKQLKPIPGILQTVKSFYNDGAGSGGSFIYDPQLSGTNHNGGAIIALDSLSVWNGTKSTVAEMLDYSGGGKGCYVRVGVGRYASDEDFGAVDGDDNSKSLLALSKFCRANDKDIKINVDNAYSEDIRFYNSMICKGKFIVKGGKPRIIFSRSSSGEAVPVTGEILSKLSAGGFQTGITGKAGYTLSLRSTEIASIRFGLNPYLKEETSLLSNNGGTVNCPHLFTYTDGSKLTIKAFPPEKPLKIKGLEFDITNIDLGVSFISLTRSDVEIDTVKLHVPFNLRDLPAEAFVCWDSANVKLVKFDIIGALSGNPAATRLGYGINLQRTLDVKIIDGEISGCKHQISGYSDKRTRVIRGNYIGSSESWQPIDSHWCYDFRVDGAYIDAAGFAASGFTGKGVKITNCEIVNASSVVVERSDLPEISGEVIIEDNDIKFTNASNAFFYGPNVATEPYGSFFGRTIDSPSRLSIQNNTYNLPAVGSDTSYIRRHTNNFSKRVIGKIDIKNNNQAGASFSFLFGPDRKMIFQSQTVVDRKMIVSIENEELVGGGQIRLENRKGDLGDFKSEFNIENSKGCGAFVSIDACSSFKYINTAVTVLKACGSPAAPLVDSFVYEVSGGHLSSIYRTANLIKLSGVVLSSGFRAIDTDFEGNTQNLSTNMYDFLDSSFGNYAVSQLARANTPPLDGYVNPLKYKKNNIIQRLTGTLTDAELSELIPVNGVALHTFSGSSQIVSNLGASGIKKVALT